VFCLPRFEIKLGLNVATLPARKIPMLNSMGGNSQFKFMNMQEMPTRAKSAIIALLGIENTWYRQLPSSRPVVRENLAARSGSIQVPCRNSSRTISLRVQISRCRNAESDVVPSDQKKKWRRRIAYRLISAATFSVVSPSASRPAHYG
jgi:hypothetical protein